jgi:PPOX class probable F420-dependent enzyme
VRLSAEEARARFAEARVATLATLGGDGAPQLVPITFAVEGELIYTAVDHKPKASARLQRLGNIARDPRVALLCQHYGDEWDELWWVRAEGRASIITDAGAMRHPLDVLAARYAQYNERRPDGPVTVISVERWTGWSAAG